MYIESRSFLIHFSNFRKASKNENNFSFSKKSLLFIELKSTILLWRYTMLRYSKLLVPDNFTSTIKTSTDYYWKNDNPHKYLGSEFSSSTNSNVDDLQIIYDESFTD